MSYRNKKTNKRVLYYRHMGLLVSYMTTHIGSLGSQCRSRVELYQGSSRKHASNASYMLSIKTGHISLQYYCIYDDDFIIVNATKDLDKLNYGQSYTQLDQSQNHQIIN